MTSARRIERAGFAALVLASALGHGCASGPLTALRFENHAPITAVNDRRPIPRPEAHEPGKLMRRFELTARVQPIHELSVPEDVLAANINALDEVPDSSWFQNRIGVRELSASEIARGHDPGGPDRSGPLRVLSSKDHGTAPGLLVADARGDRYIVKFDPAGPETETGAEVVVQRLLWAAGYNVPENSIVHLQRHDLVLAEGAHRTVDGVEAPLSQRDLDALLLAAPLAPDGRGRRALASKYLPGEPVGGYAITGVRRDDPSDRIAHEHRRDVRAQRTFFAWLGQTDVKQANTLDMWIENPKGSGLGYVRHYLVDFGKALGVWGLQPSREADGYAPHFDYGYAFRSLLSFGLWRRPWEGVEAPGLRGVGRYDAEHFDPDVYSPANPYPPFLFADRFDAFWAAKIIARFRREHVAAAVLAAEYSDPRARDYLVSTILARQRATVRHWFARVNPLDRFEVSAGRDGLRICAVDLLLAHALAGPAGTRYAVSTYDWDGDELDTPRVTRATRAGRLCVSGLETGLAHAGYTLVAYQTFRGDRELPPTIVHLAHDPRGGRLRVIGIERR